MNASLRRSIIAFFGWVILSVWAVTGQALRFEIDPITGTVTITGGCPNGLGTLSIPDTIDGRRVTGIGDYAFYRCVNLTGVIMPEGVTHIGNLAFAGCTNLAKVVIPESVSCIGDWLFSGCINLTTVAISSGVTNIGSQAFSGCQSLTAIEVDAANASYSSVDGVVFNKARSELVLCPNGRSGSYSIPEGVTRIGNHAFASCIQLTSVTLPSTVTIIGDYAFASCIQLTSITIPSDVSSIGLGAFHGCIRLRGAFFQGNAPNAGPFEFGEAGLTVYYLPGTTGWRSTFGSRPATVWTNPLVSAGTVRADGSGFAFRISWAPNATLVVEASPDLASPVWSPIATNTPAYGSWDFSDPEWVRHPSRFYRVRLP